LCFEHYASPMAVESSVIEELNLSVSPEKIREQGFRAPVPKKIIIEPPDDDPDGLEVILVFETQTDLERFGRPGVSEMFFWIAKTLRQKLEGRAVPYLSAVSESSLRYR
jgi:hypothetical protein